LVESLRPWRVAAARHARSTLELAAGEAAARGIKIGDRLKVVTLADLPGVVDASVASNNAPSPSDAADAQFSDDDKSLKVSEHSADPIRVLLVGKDRRFRSVTSALLTRRGCAVTLGERFDLATMRATRESLDVVVIDADSSRIAAPCDVASLQTLHPSVGVVVVSDTPTEAVPTAPVLAKWGPFDELYCAIQTARPDGNSRRSNDGR
jgi:hypothetical protein